MSNLVKFIRIGRSWINPKHITSVGIANKKPIFGKKFTVVEVKLSTQKSDIGGNALCFTGEQKRCCIEISCSNEKDAMNYIQKKFGQYLE
jgi:hypothetical protein